MPMAKASFRGTKGYPVSDVTGSIFSWSLSTLPKDCVIELIMATEQKLCGLKH